MKAVLIKGNPRFTRVEEAKEYYREIAEFMEGLSVEVIEDEGKPETCPPKADFYVAHSRGCDRRICFEGRGSPELSKFIEFGVPGGVIHPVDQAWWDDGCKGIPPREHFVFTANQKLAIQNMVEFIRKATTPVPIQQSRQSASRRPGVR